MFGFKRAQVFSAFISYSHDDAARAEAIARRVFHDGLDPWWDKHILGGQNWRDVIDDVLTRCSATLVLWSNTARDSDYVKHEASIGRIKRNMVPVSIDGRPPPDLHKDMHYVNLEKEGWDGAAEHPALDVIIDAIRRLQDRKLKRIDRDRPPSFEDYNRLIRADASVLGGRRKHYGAIRNSRSALGVLANDVIREKRHNDTVLAGTAFVFLTPVVGITASQVMDAGSLEGRGTCGYDCAGPPPPPPLEAVNPLEPDRDLSRGSVPNPTANSGAPTRGTPFVDKPINPNIPGDESPPVSEETGKAVSALPTPTEASFPTQASTVTPSAPKVIEASFYYFRPGNIAPSTGMGARSSEVLVPDMAFPIKSAPAIAQSIAYRYGGAMKGGDQCDVSNFTTPWRDNFCERRANASSSPWCSGSGMHLGQDIRVGSPDGCRAETKTSGADRARYEVVAAEDGFVSNVGSYAVTLRAGSGGRIYRYLHLNMAKLKVATNQRVMKGDVLGYVYNDFGNTPTPLHLHFELKLNTLENGWAYAPSYSSLLEAYKRRESNPGERVADNFAVASAPK